ncbi:MAG TPA: HAMP domain-containing sensor histidine kinase, partial [Allocoleopsis sp.]
LSFIACNIKPAQEYINQLLTLVELCQDKCNGSDAEIQNFLDEIDLDFVAGDLKSILHSMGNGAERIRSVVTALKVFTHLDESGKKSINLHESINHVLALLQHRLSSREDGTVVQIKQEYENLPPITCHADQINQVIFNLLGNAIDAIDEKLASNQTQDFQPQISICTELTPPDSLTIRITDNGIGIPPTHQPYIFEPFFTTKSAGHGVGLGLATSRRIIEEMHGGCLQYTSSSQGTNFVIQMPLASVAAPTRS